jgi:hypothetical protein
MKTFTIFWRGTVYGSSQVQAETIEEALEYAELHEDAVEIDDYPDNWRIDREDTIHESQFAI